MSTIVASQSLADSATFTSQSFLFLPETVLIVTITNGTPGPSQACQVALQFSPDNVNWTEVASRWGLFGAAAVQQQVFELSNFAGNTQSFGGGFFPVSGWVYYRLVFSGNVGAAVTIAATDGDQGNQAVVTLTGQSNTNAGCQGSWTPPWTTSQTIINNVVLASATNSNSASNIFVGAANNATTNSANLINGAQLNASAGTIVVSGANNSNQQVILNAGGSIVFTVNGNAVGYSGKAYITYTKVT